MTSSNGNIFTSLALCEGNPPVTGGFPSQRPVTRNFDAFFDLRQNKRVSRQSKRRWLETPSRSLWRHCKLVSWQRDLIIQDVVHPLQMWFVRSKSGLLILTAVCSLQIWCSIQPPPPPDISILICSHYTDILSLKYTTRSLRSPLRFLLMIKNMARYVYHWYPIDKFGIYCAVL